MEGRWPRTVASHNHRRWQQRGGQWRGARHPRMTRIPTPPARPLHLVSCPLHDLCQAIRTELQVSFALAHVMVREGLEEMKDFFVYT